MGDKDEAMKKAEPEAAKIVSEAQQKAQQIVEEAKKKAETEATKIVSEAQQKAQQIVASYSEVVAAEGYEAQQKAQQIVEEAKKKAGTEAAKIVSEAQQKAQQIVEEAKKKAGPEAAKIVSEAQQKAQQIIAEIKKKAEPEAAKIVSEAQQKAQQIIAEAERIAAAPATERPLYIMRAAREETALEAKTEEQEAGLPKRVDLVIMPPVDFAQLVKMRTSLQQFAGLRVLSVEGSLDVGTQISIQMEKPIPLVDMLRSLPVVEEAVEEEKIESHPLGSFLKKAMPVRSSKRGKEQRILLVLKRT